MSANQIPTTEGIKCARCGKNLQPIIDILGDAPVILLLHDKAHLIEDCIKAERERDELLESMSTYLKGDAMSAKPARRNYAHEVVTDVMHNVVPNLSVAQRARDQVEFLQEDRAELLECLRATVRAIDHGADGKVCSCLICEHRLSDSRALLAKLDKGE